MLPITFLRRTPALLLATGMAAALTGPVPAYAAAQDYRFELAGEPQPAPGGKSIVAVRLVHMPDGKPVAGAVVFESKADMGPVGMPTMTAPIKAMSPSNGGIYRFEVAPAMAGTFAITLAAKVQGEAETVRGSVITKLPK